MGFVEDIVGGVADSVLGGFRGGPTGGVNYTPDRAQLQQPVSMDQLNSSYGQSQYGLNQQQAFLQALQGQNGIGNQADVFNQYQGIANGTGPNPALQQLQNTTGQNIANQAALMAGQRGASANPALIARLAAQQGTNTQQQAAGQGAALQAQQQLAALGAMGNIAGQQVGQQANALGGYNAAAQNNQGQLLGSMGQYNQQQLGNTSQYNNAMSPIAQQNAQNQKDSSGKLIDAGLNLFGLFADGGMVPAQSSENHGLDYLMKNFGSGMSMNQGAMVPGKAAVSGDSLKNDKVPAMLSPKEIVIPRSISMAKDAPAKAAAFVAATLKKSGKK